MAATVTISGRWRHPRLDRVLRFATALAAALHAPRFGCALWNLGHRFDYGVAGGERLGTRRAVVRFEQGELRVDY